MIDPDSPPAIPHTREEIILALRWLHRARGMAVGLGFLLVWMAWWLENRSLFQTSIALFPLVLLFVFNVYGTITSFHVKHAGPWYVFAELVFDLLAVTLLLASTGDIGRDLTFVLFLHATLGGLLTSGMRAWLFCGALLMASLALLDPSGPPEMHIRASRWLPEAVVLLINFSLVFTLARSLRLYRHRLERARIARVRMDRLHGIGALTAGLCHQLMSPLTTIRLRLDRIVRQGGSDTDVVAIREATDQWEGILRRLVDSRADPEQYGFSSVDMVALLEEIVAEWATGKDVRLGVDLPDSVLWQNLPVVPFAHAVCDLLDNALESAETGPAEIEIALVEKGEILQLSLCDHGHGWPDLVKASLGEPFLSTRNNGAGLGLYNALLLVTALGGDLRLVDHQPRGACVILELPTTPAWEEADEPVDRRR